MASERKKPISEFGFVVKMELLKRNKNQNWLIDEVIRQCLLTALSYIKC